MCAPSSLALKRLGLWAFLLLALQGRGCPSASADTYSFAKPISSVLNVTGHAIGMSVPLKEDDRLLGDIAIRILPGDRIEINGAALIKLAGTLLTDGARNAIGQLQGTGGFVAVEALNQAGVTVVFDKALQEVVMHIAADSRAVSDLEMGPRRTIASAETLAMPAAVSGYVNVVSGLDYAWDDRSDTDTGIGASLQLDSAFRAWDTVLENSAAYESALDPTVCPAIAICSYSHRPGLRRQSTRLVKDFYDSSIRVEAGDVVVTGTALDRTPELLGFSIAHSARQLDPGANLQAPRQSSLRLDRPSAVDVVVNGATIQHFQLRAGVYNLKDLPLATGANDVELVVTDDLGHRRTEHMTMFSDTRIFAPGTSEWQIAVGEPSFLRDEGRHYASGLMGTGVLRYGLTEDVTGLAQVEGDGTVIMGGTGAALQTPFGVVTAEGDISMNAAGMGLAADLGWDVEHAFGPLNGRDSNLRFSAQYRSPNFHTPADELTLDTGIIFPEFNYLLRFDAAYSTQIGPATMATFAARYQIGDHLQQVYPGYFSGDRYGADVTVSRPLSRTTSSSITLGYSNESYLPVDLSDRTAGADFRVAVRLNVRPDDRTSVSLLYDSLNGQEEATGYTSVGDGVGRWETTITAGHTQYADGGDLNASLSYFGNRAEVRVSQVTGVANPLGAYSRPLFANPQTQLRVGVGLAYADGHFALGGPIRSDAFAIVYPHDSIGDKDVTVGSADAVRATSDAFGPALVSDIPFRTNSTLPVDVADLPIGYSLGTGAFETVAPYKAGYALAVGSDFSVTAFGTLLLPSGQPASLLSGVAYSQAHPDHQVALFTNTAGRFGVEGLAPGRWTIKLDADDDPTTYEVDIPDGTNGLFKAGALHAEAAP